MTKREVTSRYRGSFLGLFWSFLTPLFMLGVYTFVFSVVFKARWGLGSDNKLEFALTLFSGIVIFNLFSECVSRAPGLILQNANYVKKVVFPLETLVPIIMGSAIFHALISFIVLLGFYLYAYHQINWTIVFIPLVLLPLIILTLGISWFLAAIGVYFRDLNHTIGIVVSSMLFLSPVFYPITALPESYRNLFYLNPLTLPIENVRRVVLHGAPPDSTAFLIYSLVALVVALSGFAWFQKTRGGFADVI